MKTKTIRLSAALAAVAVVTALAMAATDATSVIKDRQDTMQQVGDSMKALAAIAKGEAPFYAEVVRTNAETITSHLKKAGDLFPAGSDQGDAETWAKPEVWSDPDGFRQHLENAIEAATAMQSVTEEANFMPALSTLGNGCKGCHDTYRRPKH